MSVRATSQGKRPYDQAQAFLDHLREIGERDPRIIRSVELALLRKEWQDERGVADEPTISWSVQ